MSVYWYNYDFILMPQQIAAVQKAKKDKRERIAGRVIKLKEPRFPCRAYILSTGTFRAYYVNTSRLCPYVYMDKRHNVKQCLWDKLGNQITSYKLPKFVLDY